MPKTFVDVAIVFVLCAGHASAAQAVDQTVPGAGNAEAARLAGSSALVTSARGLIAAQVERIADHTLVSNVRALVEDRLVCVRHRANETAATKQAVVDTLGAAGLIAPADAAAFPGGALAGVLPPVLEAGSPGPPRPQPSSPAPASVSAGPHSFPGACPSTRASTSSAT